MTLNIRIAEGKAIITTPYNADFVSKIKNIGGRWNAASKAWSVSDSMVAEAREIMRAVYGQDDQQTDVQTTDIRVRFNDDVWGHQEGVTLYGKTIAKAWGRDSGARVGDDVAFIDGQPKSGGSVKNWLTIVPAGSVVVIKNVPVTLLGAELPTGAEIISDVDSKREALLARKAELEAALADINNQLAAL